MLLLLSLLLTTPDVSKVSEALGHLLGKHIEELHLPLDMNAIVKGMENQCAGKTSPLTDEDCMQEIDKLQDIKDRELAKKNLEAAEKFLSNLEKETVVEGKLQFEVLKSGTGQLISNTPIVRISGHYLNGKLFCDAEEELLHLDEAIPAFQLGLAGMLEGEVRTLYVHPTLGYGNQPHLEPNALLVFEVELVRSDASADEHIALELISTQ